MKKVLYILLFFILGMNLTAQSVWDGRREAIRNGSGTEADPYLIESAQNFAWFVYLINWDYGAWAKNKHFLLTTDIDLNGNHDNQWIPIGAGNSVQGWKRLELFFDGGFHRITGFYMDTINEIYDRQSMWYPSNTAFFKRLDSNEATIKNLYLEGEIYSNKSCSGLSYQGGNIENCIVNVDITAGQQMVGGIASQSCKSISNCANLGNISATTLVGGILGMDPQANGVIENCYNMGNITGVDSSVGGIVGYTRNPIRNCYNVGNITTDIYNDGGAIIGFFHGGNASVNNCYYLEGCIENNNGYGEPKTAAFMRSQAFVDLLNSGNETNVWARDMDYTNDGFPIIGNSPFSLNENFFTNTDLVIVFPNPTTEYINIVGDVASYEMYDVVGKCVRRDARPCVSTVSVSDLQSGIYIMKFVMRNGSVVTKKIVKK